MIPHGDTIYAVLTDVSADHSLQDTDLVMLEQQHQYSINMFKK